MKRLINIFVFIQTIIKKFLITLMKSQTSLIIDKSLYYKMEPEVKEKLAIVVGHTDSNAGASMNNGLDFIQEYEYGTILAGMIKVLAGKKVDTKVILRDGVGISGAYKEVKNFKPDACVELHFNSFNNTKVSGTETLYGANAGSEDFAFCVHSKLAAALNRTINGGGDRGTKFVILSDRGGRSLNNDTGVPCIMIEPFFGSNSRDSELGLRFMREIAEAVIDGYYEWLLKSEGLMGDTH